MNIQIFSLPRSGTGYLADVLKQSPAISNYISDDYESGCKERWNSIRTHADGLLIKQIHHFLYNQDSLSEVLKDIHINFERHVRAKFYTIKLVRRNVFAQNLIKNRIDHKILSDIPFEGTTVFYEDLSGNP